MNRRNMNNKDLYVKGLWNDCTQDEFNKLFEKYGTIVQSRIYGDGVGFIEFENSHQAAEAIRELHGMRPHPKCIQPLLINYSYRKIKQPNLIQKFSDNRPLHNKKNVYIRHLPSNYTENDMHTLCSSFGTIACIRLCRKGFAFVRFLTEESAETCINKLHGIILPGSSRHLVVKYANSDPFEPRINVSAINQVPPNWGKPSYMQNIGNENIGNMMSFCNWTYQTQNNPISAISYSQTPATSPFLHLNLTNPDSNHSSVSDGSNMSILSGSSSLISSPSLSYYPSINLYQNPINTNNNYLFASLPAIQPQLYPQFYNNNNNLNMFNGNNNVSN